MGGFKDYFHGMHQNNPCQFCGKHVDSQENAIKCENVTERFSATNKELLKRSKYEHIIKTFELRN